MILSNVWAASVSLVFASIESVHQSSLVHDPTSFGQLLLGPIQIDVGPREVHEKGVGGADGGHKRQVQGALRGWLHLVVRHCL